MNPAFALVFLLVFVVTSSVPLQDESMWLDRAVRQLSAGETEPCDEGDYRCYNAIGKNYVDALRDLAGVDILQMGTETMLEYAIEHAKEMAETQQVYHQNLKSLEVGCGSMITGENIMSVHLSKKGELADGAALCADHWNNQVEASKNMLSSTHTEVVIGIARDKDDNIYCSQLFASSTQFTERGPCSPASEIYPTPEPTAEFIEPTPEPETFISSDGHVFRHKHVKVYHTDGSQNDMKLGCSDEKGCNYCTNDGSICLHEEKSIAIDIKAEASAQLADKEDKVDKKD